MDIQRYGIILNTENFDQCVAFYRRTFNLKVLFQKQEATGFKLACLQLGGSYLMIETGGAGRDRPKGINECPTALRFNVDDIESTQRHLISQGVQAEIERYDWGQIIRLSDPDGNRISIRDEEGFLKQMKQTFGSGSELQS